MEEKALRSHHKLTSTHQYEEDNNEGQRKASAQALDLHCLKDPAGDVPRIWDFRNLESFDVKRSLRCQRSLSFLSCPDHAS